MLEELNPKEGGDRLCLKSTEGVEQKESEGPFYGGRK